MSIFRHLLWSVFKAWKVWLHGIQKIEVFLSVIFKDWKVWLNGIQKIEELNSIIFKAWKVWLYGIQKIEEFNSMVFTTWKLWFYGIQKFEEFKSMLFKAWRGQNLLMGTLIYCLIQWNCKCGENVLETLLLLKSIIYLRFLKSVKNVI